jgi:thioredoxin reductase (NADPH)
VTQSDSNHYDVIVIGGGPAGSSAAIYAARAELRTLVLDKSAGAGALAMASWIANYPGIPEPIPGRELLSRMRAQAERFGATYIQDKALGTDLSGELRQVYGTEGIYSGRALIVATGAMGRSSDIPGEDHLVGRGVSYCATCDGAFFRDREVAVLGNNDEALEETLFLTRFASKIHLLSRTSQWKASPTLVEEVENQERVQIYLGAQVKEIRGEEQVEGVRAMVDGNERVIPLAGVFVFLQGRKPIVDFLGGQLPVSDTGCLLVDEAMQTGIPGVFAAGDVLCVHPKQSIVAAAEGACAAIAAERFLSGREKLKPDWG